jgi:hypothetical protein
MSSVEIFYLYVADRAFHIFVCRPNPSSNGEAYVIEVTDGGVHLVHRGNMGVFTGTSQGLYLLLCHFAAEEPHTLAEKYYLRNEINASMDNMTTVGVDSFLCNFAKHSMEFQEQAYKIMKQYDPPVAARIEAMVEMHWKKKTV